MQLDIHGLNGVDACLSQKFRSQESRRPGGQEARRKKSITLDLLIF
jgi:hypothetical protein